MCDHNKTCAQRQAIEVLIRQQLGAPSQKATTDDMKKTIFEAGMPCRNWLTGHAGFIPNWKIIKSTGPQWGHIADFDPSPESDHRPQQGELESAPTRCSSWLEPTLRLHHLPPTMWVHKVELTPMGSKDVKSPRWVLS